MSTGTITISNGYANGIKLLGSLYGVVSGAMPLCKPDVKAATSEFLKAAYQGNVEAMYALARMAFGGLIRVDGVKWLCAAALNGHKKAKEEMAKLSDHEPLDMSDVCWCLSLGNNREDTGNVEQSPADNISTH